jgi:hypothetical protein
LLFNHTKQLKSQTLNTRGDPENQIQSMHVQDKPQI